MKNMKSTKRSLLISALSLFLCVAMLAGTTFAWFTDSVSSKNNIITSGNLDVELEYKKVEDGKLSDNWETVSGKADIFDPKAYWEPGRVEVVYLKVSNLGSLALKYQLGVNVVKDTPGTNVDGKEFYLSDHLVFKTVLIEEKDVGSYTRANAVEDGDSLGFKDYNGQTTALEVGGADYVALIVYMPETVGNVANHKKSDDPENPAQYAASIEFGINLFATQLESEEDSFGSDYDAGAYLPVIYTEEELKSALENSASVKLGADIVLTGTWTPIGDKDAGIYYTGILDGNGHTISGLNVAANDYDALISAAKDATIKNLTVEGTVNGVNAAGIVARIEGKTVIENCVSNVAVTGTTKAGGIVCNVTGADAKIVNCVNNGAVSCSKAAAGGVGGIIGYVNTNATVEIIACTNNGAVTGTEDQTTGAVIGYAATNSSGKIIGFTNAGKIDGKNYVGDGYGRWIEDENGLVLAGYCGTPANWAYIASIATAEELAKVLTSDEKAIYAVLRNDIDLPITSLGDQTPGSGEYKLGGENTESITVYLNGNKLNITTSYWSAIGAKNNEATVTVQNGSMTSTGNSAGTWNAWDLRFSNCNWSFEDVDFLKAVALDNAGKVTDMKNVTITDTHNTDTYALWITAEGQKVNIDGLTIDMLATTDGRGIKIDEQYAEAADVAKVTLNVSNATFKTEEKAAILVKSVAGADITLSNVDISNVANDSVNTVWVDEDSANYYDLVSVTGGKKALESRVIAFADDLAALSGAKINGTYELVADIDLGGAEFKAMSAWYTSATFNGNGYTISNAKVVSGDNDNGTEQASMFYVSTNGSLTVSDLTLKDLTVVTENEDFGYAAAVIGYCQGPAVLNNVDVVNATVTGSKSSGMLVGHLEASGNLTATGCDVSGTITLSDYEANGHYAGEYIGTVAANAALSDCTAKVTLGGNLHSANVGTIYGRKVGGTLTVNNTNTVVVATKDALQTALDAAKPGDKIQLAAGAYDTLVIKNFWGGNYTETGVAPITIKGGEGVVVGAIDLNGMNFVNIENITFDAAKAVQVYNNGGATGDYGNIVDSANNESKSRGANHITIKDCVFSGTAVVDVSKYCPINFMGSNPSSWTYDITVEGCEFFTNAQNFIRMNNVTNNGKVVIKANTFGGEAYTTNHHAINASANGGDWEITGNTFINWNPKKCAFATGRSSAEGTTDFVITGNTFINTRIPTAADGDDGVIEIKTNSYTTTNQTLVFENNTFGGALAGLDETTIKYVKP